MNRKQIVRKGYSDTWPFVIIRVVVLNPDTGRQVAFDQQCWVDTGFTGGIHAPQFRRSEVEMIGVKPRLTSVTLAGGVKGTGYVCVALIQRVEDYDLPPPGIETELLIRGGEPGYLGLEVLRKWIAEFNGPRQTLSIYE